MVLLPIFSLQSPHSLSTFLASWGIMEKYLWNKREILLAVIKVITLPPFSSTKTPSNTPHKISDRIAIVRVLIFCVRTAAATDISCEKIVTFLSLSLLCVTILLQLFYCFLISFCSFWESVRKLRIFIEELFAICHEVDDDFQVQTLWSAFLPG